MFPLCRLPNCVSNTVSPFGHTEYSFKIPRTYYSADAFERLQDQVLTGKR